MRILWFTNNSTLYQNSSHYYHGCGWEESLGRLIKDEEGIDFAFSFFHKEDGEKITKNNITYYPILQKVHKINPIRKLIRNWKGIIKIDDLQKDVEKVISDFNPDLIQVFGTEGPFSVVQNYTNVPVLYHIQGIINPCLNTYLPVNQSKFNFHFSYNYLLKTIKGNNPAFDLLRFKNQAHREKNVLKKAKYVMGRTHWDKLVVKLFNPNVQYFHVDEVLRPAFYKISPFVKLKRNKQFKIISTLSETVYKGIDVVLKTAKLLKECANIDFTWEIIGVEKSSKLLKHFEKTEKINHRDVNVFCSGKKKPQEIIHLIQNADVYIHPSYIDNSPNSVCEAQMLGIPVIACNVGGVSTIIQDKKTGILVPSNGVFELAHSIKELEEDKDLRDRIGKQAHLEASLRHDREKILFDLMEVYAQVTKIKN